jgi:hypothetical protein
VTKTALHKYIKNNYSTREIAQAFECSQSNVRHWLRKYNLRTTWVGKSKHLPHKCPCGETDPLRFYGHRKHICANCHNRSSRRRAEERRDRAIAVLGGRCASCGFHEWRSALHIHHTDPSKKDPTFKTSRSWSWERLKKEIEACELLCANCHSGVHSGNLVRQNRDNGSVYVRVTT